MPDTADPTAWSQGDWTAAMDQVAEEDGYLERLGARHWAFFAEQGPTLLVTFERAEALRDRDGQLPAQFALVRAQGWSILTILAEGETFWRDPSVWGYFDRLVDDGFFDDFDRVLFYGAGPAGYAAAAYSVVAPGARVLLVAPRATMDPAIAGFDRRHRAARRFDFTRRYGFAPDMTAGADRVWLVHDPQHAPDAAHAALFRRPWVSVLNARRTGETTEAVLAASRILEPMIETAMEGRLTRRAYARLWRGARRSNPAYLRATLAEAAARRRPWMEIRILRSITRRMRSPRLAARLAELTGGAG